ncbi:hypothetical protein [Paenibacillus protaetiae]|uniref:Uncharacterized protein n=1 Tax=Paenibacillus protaetiae TaxID=2509456 RepID=A0A4P6EX11_9BACL|nr:hypothetical protein [Paenibacillus protaetiae]QAY67584.1 hypothetical protein ET464_15530 [Paenibacillus protaetiae]
MAESSKSNRRVGLSPPEVTYYNEIKYSIGQDPLVRVGPLQQQPGGIYSVTLSVKGQSKAVALATLMVLRKRIGNLQFQVNVANAVTGKAVRPLVRKFAPEQIVKLYTIAFRTNKLFSFAAARALFGSTFVYPVFKVSVVQFFNDDLSDYYSNYNNVAAFVFRDVLRSSVSGTPIQFSTANQK